MTRSLVRLAIPLVTGAAVAFALSACSSTDDAKKEASTDAGSGGRSGTGGSKGAGGKAGGGAGGKAGGGAGGGVNEEALYTCIYKAAGDAGTDAGPTPGGTAEAGADCCKTFGTCKAKSGLSSDPAAGSYGPDTCKASDGLVCAPKPSDELPDGGVLPACHIDFGTLSLEGRCLPKCFTEGNPVAAQLTMGDCPADTGFDPIVCAPCFDPIDGTSTGACSRTTADGGTDAPVEEGKQFAECGAFEDGPKMGLCVPTELVAQVASANLVPVDTCGTGELCAPKGKVVDQSSCFAKCAAALGGAGACTPTYIVEVVMSGISTTLGQVTCNPGETCTPCISPLDSMATGACDN